MHAKLLQACPTLCDPMDCSLPVSSVHGILQASKLEWLSRPSFGGQSCSRDGTHISRTDRSFLYHQYHLESQASVLPIL